MGGRVLVKTSLNSYVYRMANTRKYRQKKRAETVEETRSRIIEATVALHEEIGPRATSIKAIAERAGVQRLTVYRHFPDETAVFQACTSQWLTDHPLPDPGEWASIESPEARTGKALETLYRYYRQTAAMWDRAHRDGPEVEALHEPMQQVATYLEAIATDLATSWGNRDTDFGEGYATLRHAVAFPTWQSLAGLNLDDSAMARLATRWAAASFDQGETRDAVPDGA